MNKGSLLKPYILKFNFLFMIQDLREKDVWRVRRPPEFKLKVNLMVQIFKIKQTFKNF